MTTRTISGTYANGYFVATGITQLDITPTGRVTGTGVSASALLSVDNHGTVASAAGSDGVSLAAGGSVRNEVSALVSGATGVEISQGGTIANFGTVLGTGSASTEAGVVLGAGGSLVNGSATDTTALIQSTAGDGVIIASKAGTVANFGTIHQYSHYGVSVYLKAGGGVTNGSATDTAAEIYGYSGVEILGSAGAFTNFGLVTTGNSMEAGVFLQNGGTVTNGTAADAAATIQGGGGGVVVEGTGAVINYGTVTAFLTAGVDLASGVLVNGGGSDPNALITSADGAGVYANGVVVNWGTISGFGTAVALQSATSELVVEAGCVFVGAVQGDGGTLSLATGTGTISGLAGGGATVSGSIPIASFSDFGTVDIGSGASFTLSGKATVASDESLVVSGSLTTAATIGAGGTLAVSGVIGGTGALAIGGGTATFNTGTSLTIAKVTVRGTASVRVAAKVGYAKTWVQTGGTLSVLVGDQVTFTGTGDMFTGTLTGAGTLGFAGGSDTLKNLTLSATHMTIGGAAAVTLSGTVFLTGILNANTANLIVATGGATLSGGGTLVLANTASNSLHGTSATARLINNDRIQGAGQLGGGVMALVNQAAGMILGNGAMALSIDTGANSIGNAGLIESAGTGGVTIAGAVSNTGTLETLEGGLTVKGPVTGGGKVVISGGAADFASTFAQAVTFGVGGGALELGKSQTYTGALTGFSKTGATSLDLDDIAFTAGTTKATFAGTKSFGTLTVTDGSHVAKIKLLGNYLASTFMVSSDGHGGSEVVDPPASNPPHAFIAAMAAFTLPAGAVSFTAASGWHEAPARLNALSAPAA